MGNVGRDAELTDGAVMARSMAEPTAFVALFDRHGRAVHAYLSRRAGTQAADDLLGEVWLQAFRSRGSFDAARPDARPWLYGIARHLLRAHWHAGARPLPPPAPEPPDPWDDVDSRLDAQGERDALRRALDALPDLDREVLLLVAWESLTPTEVAECLGMPAGTVRWRLHRARSRLREHLTERDVPTSTAGGPRWTS
jgi:RNA polymerase sigma-70 factor (ECF subfamily)